MTDTNPSPTENVTVSRELLVDIRDNGLIYWEPQTERGFIARTEMVNQIDKALASTPTAREQALKDALKPFAEILKHKFTNPLDWNDDDGLAVRFDGKDITVGDLRRAAQALAKSSPPTGEPDATASSGCVFCDLDLKIEAHHDYQWHFAHGKYVRCTHPDQKHPVATTPAPQRQTVDDAAVEEARRIAINEAAKEAWQNLMDKDDRNSPSDYPEHCLITRKELTGYIFAALHAAFTQEN